MERMERDAADNLVAVARHMDSMIDHPYGKEKLTERERVVRYALMREDPQAWQALISEHGPGPAVKYALELESLREKYPEEAGYFEAPDFSQIEQPAQLAQALPPQQPPPLMEPPPMPMMGEMPDTTEVPQTPWADSSAA